MLLISLSLMFGFIMLIWSADRFISGAMGLAYHLNLPPLVIGIVIVGFGTSAPELLVSTMAALQGSTGLALGNAIGSNITNIALVLGVTACLTPLVVKQAIFRREFPLLVFATLFTWLLLRDQFLSTLDACAMLLLMFVLLTVMAQSTSDDGQQKNVPEEPSSLVNSLFWLLLGLSLLITSSNVLVKAAVDLALLFGISDVVIGLTIIAIGTSLPELAASVTGALKHHTDLAVGNIIGSNIFNTLGVIAVPGLITSYAIPSEVLSHDFIVMLTLTIALIILAFLTRKAGGLAKFSGFFLISCFIAYQVSLYLRTVTSG